MDAGAIETGVILALISLVLTGITALLGALIKRQVSAIDRKLDKVDELEQVIDLNIRLGHLEPLTRRAHPLGEG